MLYGSDEELAIYIIYASQPLACQTCAVCSYLYYILEKHWAFEMILSCAACHMRSDLGSGVKYKFSVDLGSGVST